MNNKTFLAGKAYDLTARQSQLFKKMCDLSEIPHYILFERLSIGEEKNFSLYSDTMRLIHLGHMDSSETESKRIYEIFKDKETIDLSNVVLTAKVKSNKTEEYMPVLKKLTNFIESLKEPKKSYVRLGWIEIIKDEWYVTEKGTQAIGQALLISGISLDEHAKAEIKRITDEKKKKCKKSTCDED